ncbi:MAG: CYTH and CHAD domain-containing protein [Burkholderiales bacterium]
MGAVPVETELKLRVSPAAIRRLFADPLLKTGARSPARKLTTVYYDTPDLDLCRHGAALRVRRDGDRWIQTVKWGGDARSGLHQRNEIEAELPGEAPDLSKITNAHLDALFRSSRIAAAVRPVFETSFTRSTRLLELGDAQVEVSLDRGEITCGDRREPLSELELELKRGAVPALFELALKLAERVPMALENRSKAERGYALFRWKPDAPTKAAASTLPIDFTVAQGFAVLAWESLRQLHANEDGVLRGEDPEYLHQMRVALRRLRSTFSAFARAIPGPARDRVLPDLRWLGGRLGPARDWDVFVTETLPAISGAFGGTAFEALSSEAARRRAASQREVRRTLRSRRYQRAMLSIACWLVSESWREGAEDAQLARLDSPLRAYAQAELERRYERVRKGGRKLGELDAAGRHELRIAIKKLRYSVEFFASLFEAAPARALRARLARLQDILGTMNDAVAIQRLLADVMAGTENLAVAEARGILFGWSAGRGEALEGELNRAWRAFRRSETFW